jgi:hypothetical protein
MPDLRLAGFKTSTAKSTKRTKTTKAFARSWWWMFWPLRGRHFFDRSAAWAVSTVKKLPSAR